MLELKNISKVYETGSLVTKALDDVSINFRDNEFVAVLGPSGSGKTTLLNIIGGLDRYDSGDLIINGKSTKKYKDRDYDTYRNHSVGFVFQTYNLIPHQTILSNVELALTIAGVSKAERKRRALEALDEVGLKDQARKKPNQLSGGQMQRVAIARALVNNPDILLADEPTGALDSKTSVQVMELMKKVARDRLVVMVTHNPELAEKYATRTVNLMDGQIVSDTSPAKAPEQTEEVPEKKVRKARMSFLTALGLSFNNLLTKKGRTFLTSFAGSIGIIGIALILSLSHGFQNYIDKIQEDTLSSYPLTITSETMDATSAILSMISERSSSKDKSGNTVKERQYLTTMFSSIGKNDLKSFKEYLGKNESEYKNDVTFLDYRYSVNPFIYTRDAAGNISQLNPSRMMSSMMQSASSFMGATSGVFSKMNNDVSGYTEDYEILSGRWPEKYDEMIIVLSEKGSISDLLVYSLGIRDTSELKTILTRIMSGEDAGVVNPPMEFTYDDLLNLEMKLIRPADLYSYNSRYDIYENMTSDEEYMDEVYENAMKLKIVGVVCLKEGKTSLSINQGVCYRSDLIDYIINDSLKQEIVKKQLSHKERDVFSGNRFDEENEKKDTLDFDEMISVDEDMLKDAFKVNISEDDFKIKTMSESEMQQVIMEAARAAAQSVNSGPDKTMLTALFGAINTAYLNQQTLIYDTANLVTMDIPLPPVEEGAEPQVQTVSMVVIDDEKLSAVRSTIDGKTYRQVAETLSAADPSLAGIFAMLDMISESQYEILASGVSSMFDEYYSEIRNSSEFDQENSRIPYTYDEDSGLRIYGTSLNSYLLISEVATGNETALSNITLVMNEMVEDYMVYMIAAQIGTATGKIVSPLTESLKGLADALSGDIITVDTDAFREAFTFTMDEDELSRLMETMLNGSEEKSYAGNLLNLGYQDFEEPTAIYVYFKDFDSKERFLDFIGSYNRSVDEDREIKYQDLTGILMSSVKTIVDVVTYVLIAFVSISLIVSSIMIAVITLISVMERTKEIGILRSIGASRRNVSSIFNAETFIIGLLSGLIGVGTTFLLNYPINMLIHKLTGNTDINSVLPYKGAVILVIISVGLTMLAGLMPSGKAAKQDPVVALRTE